MHHGAQTAMASRRKKITLAGPQPGRENRFEVGERTIVDPMAPGTLTRAAANVRESSVAHMHSRGRLNNAQVAVSDRFRRLWELAAIGKAFGIDFEHEGRSIGRVGDPLTDDVVYAGAEMAKVMKSIGLAYWAILVALVGERKSIADVAKRYPDLSGRRAEGYVSGTLVDALDALVRLWGAEGRGEPRKGLSDYGRNGERVPVRDAIRATGPIEFTGPAREVSVGRFGDVHVEAKRPIDRGPLSVHIAGSSDKSAPRRKK